jgi:hypothetical protein
MARPLEVCVVGWPRCQEPWHVVRYLVGRSETGNSVFGSISDCCRDIGIRQGIVRPLRCLIEAKVLTCNNDIAAIPHVCERHCPGLSGAATYSCQQHRGNVRSAEIYPTIGQAKKYAIDPPTDTFHHDGEPSMVPQ